MSAFPLLLLVSLTGAGGSGTGGAARAAVRSYVANYSVTYLARAHARIPAWARKYNMNCSGCHYPAAPRLNATGMRFKWAGYRMPEDFNDAVSVEKVQNYLAVRGRMRYGYSKPTGGTASSGFAFEDATIFYGGPLGKNYSAFFEFERAAEDNVELVASIGGKWGKPTSYSGVRVGQFHWLLREGLAGFDRPTGITTPIPVGGALTGSIPFSFANDQLGIEAFTVHGNNRLSAQVLNGINFVGKGDEGEPDTKKDYVVIDQLLLDNAGSGITAVGYYGTLVGADTASPTVMSHFWRVGLSANKIVNNFEILGSVLLAKDQDLPTGGAFSAAENTGRGYWLSGQYMFPSSLTVFGRYEFVDPNTKVADNGKTRIVLGGVLPVNLPEYLRMALEYYRDIPQNSASAKTNSLVAQLMLNF